MKLHNLTITNFRNFDQFSLNHLGRINLLVGTNNSGKTTVLEAAFVLMTQRLWSIWNILYRRGEVFPVPTNGPSPSPTNLLADVRHLFPGHLLTDEGTFELRGATDSGLAEVSVAVKFAHSEVMAMAMAGAGPAGFDRQDFPTDAGTPVDRSPSRLQLMAGQGLTATDGPYQVEVELEGAGGLNLNSQPRDSGSGLRLQGNRVPYFVSSGALNNRTIARLYNDILLQPEEDLVLDAVRLISPEIERIAPVGAGTEDWPGLPPARDGIMLRLAGVKERVPIGSMGDGIWRMLGLALAVVHSKENILLIDEIDTGLHHTVMDKMWRFLNECSQRFNIQIIATTHSRDCYQSLAEICRDGVDEPNQSAITIQRIERNRLESVVYSEAMIIAAAQNDVEVR